MNFISGIIENSIAGFVESATVSIGGQAGDLLIRAGDAIENVGRGYGNSVSGKFDNWGEALKSRGGTPRSALPSTKAAKVNGNVSRSKTIARSSSTPAVAKGKTSNAVSKVPPSSKSSVVTATAAPKAQSTLKTQSKPNPKRVSSLPSQPRPDNIKYTPGVLTGMPKANSASVKPAAPSNKSGKQGGKLKGGEVKYTPGKLTGMPTQAGVKSSRPAQVTNPSKPSMKRADSKGNASTKAPGERIDRTFF